MCVSNTILPRSKKPRQSEPLAVRPRVKEAALSSAIIFVITLCPTFALSQATGQQTILPLDQRIAIAKKLIAVDREAALADPSDPARANYFTETSALLEPKWTAKFIIDNPIKGNSDDTAHENNAICNLLSRPQLLSEEQVLTLVDYYPFMATPYLRLAIDSLPDGPEFDSLRKKLRTKAIAAMDDATAKTILFTMFGPANFSHLAHDSQAVTRINRKIADFYTSGEAEKTWKEIQQQPQGSSGYYLAKFTTMAPEGFDLSFVGKATDPNVVHGFEIGQVLTDDSRSDQQKANWLETKTEIEFGTERYDAFTSATNLGLVAKFDTGKALDWSQTAPSPIVQILARLAIATEVARQDRPSAIKLVSECYEHLLAIDLKAPVNRGDTFLLNTAPLQVATSGLRIANQIDGELLKQCVAQTIQLIARDLKPTNEYARMGRVYRSLAAVARYDHAVAREIFERCSDEVQIAHAAEFFTALVAIDPQSVLEEYETLPEDIDNPANAPRYRVRQAIGSALAQPDEEMFWAKLQSYHYIQFPKSLFR